MKKIITPLENVKFVYEAAASAILNYTPQLFTIKKDGSELPEAHGSSVLIFRDNHYYLVTAGHCVKQKDELIKIGVMVLGNFHFIKGAVLINKGYNDTIDLAIVKLELETISVLKKIYVFLPDKDILSNKNIEKETDYLMVGYPLSKTSIDYKRKKIKTEPFVFVAKSKEDKEYSKLAIKQEQNILLGFNKRKSSFVGENEMNISPIPTGISGGGLWYIPSYLSHEIVFKLTGVMIEHFSKKNLMLATKAEEVLKLISLFKN